MAQGEGAAVAAAAIAQAIKATGTIVSVEPNLFAYLLRKTEKPLVVYTQGGIFKPKHQYMTSYKGLAFFTRSREQIDLPRGAEVIVAKKFWMPG